MKKAYILLITFLLYPLLFFGQNNPDENQYYNWFDQMVGRENIGLHVGQQYLDYDINKILNNKHAFFRSEKVLRGDVTYNNQTYYDVYMRYNLENDLLLVSLKLGSVASILQLIQDKVENFTIDGTRFIRRTNVVKEEINKNGFYEVLTENKEFQLLKKNRKNRIQKIEPLNGNSSFYEFVDVSKYYVFFENRYTTISSKNDIIKIFPDFKKEIIAFYKENKKLKKSEPDVFFQRLFENKISHYVMSIN